MQVQTSSRPGKKENLSTMKWISRLEYEYIAKGFIFRKGRIKVTVSRVSSTDLHFPKMCELAFSSCLTIP